MTRSHYLLGAGVVAGRPSSSPAAPPAPPTSPKDLSNSSSGTATPRPTADVLDEHRRRLQRVAERRHVTTEIKTWDVIDDTLLPALSSDNRAPTSSPCRPSASRSTPPRTRSSTLDDFYADADEQRLGRRRRREGDDGRRRHELRRPDRLRAAGDLLRQGAVRRRRHHRVPDDLGRAGSPRRKQLTVDENGDGTPEQYGLVLPDHATVGNGVWPSLFWGGGGEIVADGEAVGRLPGERRHAGVLVRRDRE